MDLQSLLRSADPAEPGADAHARPPELRRRIGVLESELTEQAPVVTAAVLTAAAFRLRDEAGLITALRGLVGAVAGFEKIRAAG